LVTESTYPSNTVRMPRVGKIWRQLKGKPVGRF